MLQGDESSRFRSSLTGCDAHAGAELSVTTSLELNPFRAFWRPSSKSARADSAFFNTFGYVSAKAPTGYENNYMKTVDTDGWFVYFRL